MCILCLHHFYPQQLSAPTLNSFSSAAFPPLLVKFRMHVRMYVRMYMYVCMLCMYAYICILNIYSIKSTECWSYAYAFRADHPGLDIQSGCRLHDTFFLSLQLLIITAFHLGTEPCDMVSIIILTTDFVNADLI